MEQNQLQDVVQDALRESELHSRDIPAIDLYVDQILNLVAERLKGGSVRYHDRQLTKTMINNYSKDGIITPVKGKKYSTEQIVQMLTIYTLKNTLTIGQIKRLLGGAYELDGFGGDALTALYDRHLVMKEANRTLATETMTQIIEREGLDVSDDIDTLSLMCALLSLSAQLKNMAEAILDAQFPEPDWEEEKEQRREEKEAKKEEKKEEKEAKKEEKKEEKERAKKQKAKAKESKKTKVEEKTELL